MDSSRNAARTLRFPMRSAHSFVSGCGSSASSPDGEEPVASGGAFEKVEKSSQAAVPEPEEAPDIFPLEGTLKRLFSAPSSGPPVAARRDPDQAREQGDTVIARLCSQASPAKEGS